MNPISEEVQETTIFSGDHIEVKLKRTSLAYRYAAFKHSDRRIIDELTKGLLFQNYII